MNFGVSQKTRVPGLSSRGVVCVILRLAFLANVLRYVRYMLSAVRLSVVCCLLSVVCLLSVTLVHPTQAVELFGNFLTIR